MLGSIFETVHGWLFGRRAPREWKARYAAWGDSKHPEPLTVEPDRKDMVREHPKGSETVAVQPWECLRSEQRLFLLQTMHTPFKAVSDEDQDRLDENLRRIEEELMSPDLEKYAAECYALVPNRDNR